MTGGARLEREARATWPQAWHMLRTLSHVAAGSLLGVPAPPHCSHSRKARFCPCNSQDCPEAGLLTTTHSLKPCYFTRSLLSKRGGVSGHGPLLCQWRKLAPGGPKGRYPLLDPERARPSAGTFTKISPLHPYRPLEQASLTPSRMETSMSEQHGMRVAQKSASG